MLTPRQFDTSADAILALFHDFEDVVLADIARRLANLDFASAAWQVQRLNEAGALYENIVRRLSTLTGLNERAVAQILRRAGVQSMRFDDRIYRMAGLDPLPLNLSPQMTGILKLAIQRTAGTMNNLTQTTAIMAQQSFMRASDLAFLQVSTGTLGYDQAIRRAVLDLGGSGLEVMFPSGKVDKLDVAMRRSVLTGVGQMAGELQWARADELGVDLVQTSAHIGARPSHQLWQGRIFSLSGRHPRYPDFIAETGWGTVTGLGGANCRHSYFPFFEGISENAYSEAMREHMSAETVSYQGKELTAYEASQVQRGIERKIREWKRRTVALEGAGLEAVRETAKIRQWQAQMREFLRQTGLRRQSVRELV